MALEESRSHERARRKWIESERERLQHEEQKARDRADLTRNSLQRVHLDALEKLEKVLEQKDQFEQKIAVQLAVPKTVNPMNNWKSFAGVLAMSRVYGITDS